LKKAGASANGRIYTIHRREMCILFPAVCIHAFITIRWIEWRPLVRTLNARPNSSFAGTGAVLCCRKQAENQAAACFQSAFSRERFPLIDIVNLNPRCLLHEACYALGFAPLDTNLRNLSTNAEVPVSEQRVVL